MIAINISKHQALYADSKKKIQPANFIGNLNGAKGATLFFIFIEAKETVLDFPQGTV